MSDLTCHSHTEVMNKRLMLVWGLWVLQIVGGLGFSVRQKMADDQRVAMWTRAVRSNPGDTSSVDPSTSGYLMAHEIGDRLADTWILYGVLCSGVFVVLTTWATKSNRPQPPNEPAA